MQEDFFILLNQSDFDHFGNYDNAQDSLFARWIFLLHASLRLAD